MEKSDFASVLKDDLETLKTGFSIFKTSMEEMENKIQQS